MNVKNIKKGDLVKVKTADGTTKIIKVDKVSKKEIKGDVYEYEKDYSKSNFCSYKVKDKNISFENEVIGKIDGQLISNNLRIKVEKKLINAQEINSEEEVKTKGKKRNTTKSSPRSSASPSSERKDRKEQNGKRKSTKQTQQNKEMSTLKVSKKRGKSAVSQNSPEMTQKQQMKLERDKVKEEKKKERERKRRLKQIIPNDKIEEIELNPFLEKSSSKKEQKFPLEGCSKFSDNRKFLFYYFQNNKKARTELERLISNDNSLSNPFQYYSTDVAKNLMDFAIKDNDIELVKLLIKESNRINKGEAKRPILPSSSLSNVGSGVFNIYQFGFATKSVSLARGGREGNNAFTYDSGLINTHYYCDLNRLIELDASYEVLQCFIMNKSFAENNMFEHIWMMVRRGNIEFLKSKLKKDGPSLLQRLCDNMGYGFNRYHYLAVEGDVEGRINRISMVKKPHTNKGISPLHIACINPDITVLKKFYTANPEISVSDADQRKMIHYAAANKTDAALNFLSSKGVNLNDRDLRGTTPLMIACELGRIDNVLFLLKEQKKQIEGLDENDEDYLLIKKTSNLINVFGPNHQSPLHFAILSGSNECVKALVENSDNEIDLNVTTTDGKSPMSLACSLGHYEIAKYLLSKGASVHETKKQKKNALIWAVQNGHIHIVSLLLRHGIHPDITDSSGNTAVHYAAGYGWQNVLEFLVKNGAHPDLKNDWNSTPAMIAMLKNHFGCLDYLMGLENVNKSMVDNEGRSVISQLCMNFTKDTLAQIKYMDKFQSIDYNLKDARGLTCMHFLACTQIQYYQITNKIHEILVEKKAELERRIGRSLSGDRKKSPGISKFRPKKKRMSNRPSPSKFEKIKMPSLKLNSSMETKTDDEVDEEEDDENLQVFSIYYDQGNVKHRELFREISDEFQDKLIECAEYLYSKGVNKDSFSDDGYSALRFAVDQSNIKLALWMIDKISDIKDDHFKIDDSKGNTRSFLSNFCNFNIEIDWEPLIKILIKDLDKESLHQLISVKQNGSSILINYVKSKPNLQYRANDKVAIYQNKIFQKNLDLLIELAEACYYDVSDQIVFNKSYAYGFDGITQEKINSYFESPNELMLDKRINSFGIYNSNLNESEFVYLQEGCPFAYYGLNEVRSTMLHTIIKSATNENDMF